MIVNSERLKELIKCATLGCDFCPLCDKDDEICSTDPCLLAVTNWLTEFDVQTALEDGAHIVNDRAIFPPQEVKMSFLGTEDEK